jgi:hypothetical protein
MRKNPQQVKEWLKGIEIPNKKSLDDIIASFE